MMDFMERAKPLRSDARASREALLARVKEIDARYQGRPVPRPPHWGGYRLIPRRIEHWVNGEGRLHDRFIYERDSDGSWNIIRVNP